MQLTSTKILQTVSENCRDKEPSFSSGLERYIDSYLKAATYNFRHDEKYYFKLKSPDEKIQEDQKCSNTPDFPDIISDNTECRAGDVQRNKETDMEVSYNESDVDDSFSDGPPVLSPQVEIVEDDGHGKSTLDCQFEDSEDVDTISSHHTDSNSSKSSTASCSKVGRISHKRKSSELWSILKKPTKRPNFNYAQCEALFATWEVTDSPSVAEVLELVHITGLTATQVRGWFKNKRRGTRRAKANGDSDEVKRNKTLNNSVTDLNLDTKNNSHINGNRKLESPINTSNSSRNLNRDKTWLKLTRQKKQHNRIEAIKCIPQFTLEESMETTRARLSQLILLYMKKKLDMRRTLLRETAKLKEMTASSPFSQSQLKTMKCWRDEFFAEVCGELLNEDKKQKLSFVRSNVIEVWHPVIIYGKLSKVSLEAAIQDFSAQNETKSIADSEEFTVPGILRYMESHFQ